MQAVVGEAVSGGDRCPQCGAAFACQLASGACWCARVTLSAQRRRELAERYDGCLCQACLRDLERVQRR